MESQFTNAFSEYWQDIIKVRVKLFGLTSSALFVWALVGFLTGSVSGHTVLATFLFAFSNLAISKISKRLESGAAIEHFRLIFNSLSLPFVLYLADGSYSPFWFPYAIMCLSAPSTTYLFTENKRSCYLQIAYWVVHFAFFSWIEHKFTDFYSFSVAAALIAVPGIYLVHLMHMLRKSLMNERDKREALHVAQESLARAGKLSALGEMAGGIAHEINTPLATIKIAADQMRTFVEAEKIDVPMLRLTSERIDGMVDRISRIVKGLRSFSRDGSLDPYSTVKVKELLENTLGLCTERIRNYGIQLQVVDFDSTLTFEGRPTEISQVILNLLNNAFDAVTADPEAEQKWIEIQVADVATAVEIRVLDSGAGVTETAKKKLFQPFYTTKAIGKGVGLGLSISLGIVKSHSGELVLDPTGDNTCFILRLPKLQSQATRAA